MTPEKITWLWGEMKKYRTLFSDLTRDKEDNFAGLITQAFSFWMEVVDENDDIIGIIYLTEMHLVTECSVHILFLDKKLSEKQLLCRKVLRWVFDEFMFHRLTAVVPKIFFMTVRLAHKLGFVDEGIKREAHLMGGKWIDELQMGLLRNEVL